MGLIASLLAATAVATATPAGYLEAHQQPDGGFAEQGRHSDPTTTAWAALALASAGRAPAGAAAYLSGKPISDVTGVALRILALHALGASTDLLRGRLETYEHHSGPIGPAVNSTIWALLALRAVRRPVAKASVSYLLHQQRRNGGWSWYPGGSADSNDTAAAIEALRASGVRGRPIRGGLRYLRRLEHRDGGFALVRGRASDAQSTAWAVQAFLAAGSRPPAGAYRFLARMRRADGSYRYSARYVTTPVFVTAQVLPALVRRPFPL
jgi:prenyltransferase beta subunit